MATASASTALPPSVTSPAVRLYRHALESIFAYCTLRELHSLMSVCKDWNSAVCSMRPLGVSWSHMSLFRCVCFSALGRHVSELEGRFLRHPKAQPDVSLQLISEHMGHLKRLLWEMQLLTPDRRSQLQQEPVEGLGLELGALEPFAFPLSLETLFLTVPPTISDVQTVLDSIGRLPALKGVSLFLPPYSPHLRFSALARSSRERQVVMEHCSIHETVSTCFKPSPNRFTDEQVDDIRAGLNQVQRLDIDLMSSEILQRLFQPPSLSSEPSSSSLHGFAWEVLAISEPYSLDDSTAQLVVAHLPSLTNLQVSFSGTSLRFLARLPHLKHLSLEFSLCDTEAEDLLDGLEGRDGGAALPKVKTLFLDQAHPFQSDTIGQLVAMTPQLTSLTLYRMDYGYLTSLAFLSSPDHSLANTLEDLSLYQCYELPLAELEHIHSLHALRKLEIADSFVAALHVDTLAAYTPPSALLPNLEKFIYEPPGGFEAVEPAPDPIEELLEN